MGSHLKMVLKIGYFRKRKDYLSNDSAPGCSGIEILSLFEMGSQGVISKYLDLQRLL